MKPRLLATTGRDDLALVHLLRLGDSSRTAVETVDSIDPRYPRGEKAVIIISTQFGCPVGCLMCDAAGPFHGNLDAAQMLEQVRFVMERRPENRGSRKLKVHFARMGEPSLNDAVLEALERLPGVVETESLMPCISTVAPRARWAFFDRLLDVKERSYAPGRFQIQFSVNTTDPDLRARLIPMDILSLEEIGSFAHRFHLPGDRKVVLNFALGRHMPVDIAKLQRAFAPEHFMVKLTPINPTERARQHGLDTIVSAADPGAAEELVEGLRAAGFDTVVSIGDPDEIEIGSNCGQLVRAMPEWKEAAVAG